MSWRARREMNPRPLDLQSSVLTRLHHQPEGDVDLYHARWRKSTRTERPTRRASALRPDPAQVGEAFAGDPVGPGGEVESLDRQPAVVAHLVERLADRREIQIAHPGAEQVRVIDLDVADGVRGLAPPLAG